jgi:hypothetical protein
MKICPVGAKLFHDGWTDTTKLIVSFRNFGNAPKKNSKRVVKCVTPGSHLLCLRYAGPISNELMLFNIS